MPLIPNISLALVPATKVIEPLRMPMKSSARFHVNPRSVASSCSETFQNDISRFFTVPSIPKTRVAALKGPACPKLKVRQNSATCNTARLYTVRYAEQDARKHVLESTITWKHNVGWSCRGQAQCPKICFNNAVHVDVVVTCTGRVGVGHRMTYGASAVPSKSQRFPTLC